MLRQISLQVANKTPVLVPRAGYKNFVMSEALAQIEKDCERFCPVPRFPPQKVSNMLYNLKQFSKFILDLAMKHMSSQPCSQCCEVSLIHVASLILDKYVFNFFNLNASDCFFIA